MLDDLAYIHERDQADALGINAKQWEQLEQEFFLPDSVEFKDITAVVHAGMGGSALPALFVQSWPEPSVPFVVTRNYELPAFVGPNTLVICDSFSGNTEETLAALQAAQQKQAQVAVITGGGKLEQIANEQNLPLVVLPSIAQPRYAAFANYKAVLAVLGRAGVVDLSVAQAEAQQAADFLKEQVALWLPDVPTAKNPAKELAQEILGKSVVIYSGPKLSPAAYKWKISFNENAKHIAWVNQLPEFNHNEFIGWSRQPVDKPYAVIDLRSNLENERTQKRFDVSARLLSGMRPEPHVVTAQGKTLLEQLVWTSVFGDFVTLYTALLSGIDPAPVDLVEKFKKELEA